MYYIYFFRQFFLDFSCLGNISCLGDIFAFTFLCRRKRIIYCLLFVIDESHCSSGSTSISDLLLYSYYKLAVCDSLCVFAQARPIQSSFGICKHVSWGELIKNNKLSTVNFTNCPKQSKAILIRSLCIHLLAGERERWQIHELKAKKIAYFALLYLSSFHFIQFFSFVHFFCIRASTQIFVFKTILCIFYAPRWNSINFYGISHKKNIVLFELLSANLNGNLYTSHIHIHQKG